MGKFLLEMFVNALFPEISGDIEEQIKEWQKFKAIEKFEQLNSNKNYQQRHDIRSDLENCNLQNTYSKIQLSNIHRSVFTLEMTVPYV